MNGVISNTIIFIQHLAYHISTRFWKKNIPFTIAALHFAFDHFCFKKYWNKFIAS